MREEIWETCSGPRCWMKMTASLPVWSFCTPLLSSTPLRVASLTFSSSVFFFYLVQAVWLYDFSHVLDGLLGNSSLLWFQVDSSRRLWRSPDFSDALRWCRHFKSWMNSCQKPSFNSSPEEKCVCFKLFKTTDRVLFLSRGSRESGGRPVIHWLEGWRFDSWQPADCFNVSSGQTVHPPNLQQWPD